MPNLTADEIVTQKHKRNFIQFGGPRPGNTVNYAGANAQYLSIQGVANPESGNIDPIWVPDPQRRGRFRLVGRKFTAPALPTATLLMYEKHGSIPRQLGVIGCAFNMYEVTGPCRDPSDFLGGWSDYVQIYSGAIVTTKDEGNRTNWDSDDAITDSMSLTLSAIYPVGSLSFGDNAATAIDKEVVDVTYGSTFSCGDCGPANSGADWIYAVTKSSGGGSPGLPGELIYSTNGGSSWSQVNIDNLGASEDPLAVAIAGIYLVVIGTDAYYYAEINANTGVPGTFTKVTNGFVAAKSPQDLYVANAAEIYFVGNGGYVYKSTDITSGVSVISAGDATTSNLSRVHGVEDTIVAAGAGGAVVYSLNRGRTWATPAAAPTTSAITGVSVLSKVRWWVCTINAYLWSTQDGGNSWTRKGFSGEGVGQCKDIVFATDEVGYLAVSNATPRASILATWNGGQDWTKNQPRINNMPTFNYANRIAVPFNMDPATASNNVAVAGLSGSGTDGVLLLGLPSLL